MLGLAFHPGATRSMGGSSSTTARRCAQARPPGMTTRPVSRSFASRPQIPTGPIRRRSGCCSKSTSRSSTTTAARSRSGRATATCICRSATAAAPTTSASVTWWTYVANEGGTDRTSSTTCSGKSCGSTSTGALRTRSRPTTVRRHAGLAEGATTSAYGLRNPYRCRSTSGAAATCSSVTPVGAVGGGQDRGQGRRVRLERQEGGCSPPRTPTVRRRSSDVVGAASARR